MHSIRIFLLAWAVICFAGGPAAAAEDAAAGEAKVNKITYPEVIDLVQGAKGKVVLINFWATWCAPCREEIPELKRLRKDMGEDELTVVGISLDSSIRSVERFVDRYEINYPVYLGGQDIINAYSLMAIPRTVIYNGDGQRAFSHEGFMNRAMLKRAISGLMADAE